MESNVLCVAGYWLYGNHPHLSFGLEGWPSNYPPRAPRYSYRHAPTDHGDNAHLPSSLFHEAGTALGSARGSEGHRSEHRLPPQKVGRESIVPYSSAKYEPISDHFRTLIACAKVLCSCSSSYPSSPASPLLWLFTGTGIGSPKRR
jgi:hypothetical protein